MGEEEEEEVSMISKRLISAPKAQGSLRGEAAIGAARDGLSSAKAIEGSVFPHLVVEPKGREGSED